MRASIATEISALATIPEAATITWVSESQSTAAPGGTASLGYRLGIYFVKHERIFPLKFLEFIAFGLEFGQDFIALGAGE